MNEGKLRTRGMLHGTASRHARRSVERGSSRFSAGNETGAGRKRERPIDRTSEERDVSVEARRGIREARGYYYGRFVKNFVAFRLAGLEKKELIYCTNWLILKEDL